MSELPVSTVYGPVQSWREGASLGIDLILNLSTCSFNCIYCQLGEIQDVTNQRRLFVETKRVISDFRQSRWQEADIITFSGSGEPTLALNLGEVSRAIKLITDKPQLILTNGTHLDDEAVIDDLQSFDRVYVKLDAATESIFQRINRPAEGITLEKILSNIRKFKTVYSGYFGIQIMMGPANQGEFESIISLLNDIRPNEAQLNTPTRPYAKEWHVASRGGHSAQDRPYASVALRPLPLETIHEMADRITRETGIPVRPYKPLPE